MLTTNPSERLAKLVDALYEACRPLDRGEVLPLGTIAAALGCEPHADQWNTCIRKLKRRMEDERGITLWADRAVGYRLLTEQEQMTLVPKARARRARRQYRMARRSVEAIPEFGLSDHQLRLKHAQLEALRLGQKHLNDHARRQAALDKPIECLPRRAVG